VHIIALVPAFNILYTSPWLSSLQPACASSIQSGGRFSPGQWLTNTPQEYA